MGDTSATLGSLLAGWRALRDVTVKPGTRASEDANVRLYIEPKFGRGKVRDINKNAITTWLGSLTKQDGGAMNDGTKALILAQLSSILNYAVDENVIAANPCKAISRTAKPTAKPRKYRTLADGELDKLLNAIPKRRMWLAPIIRLTALTGLRLGEVVALQWGDVNFDASRLRVERQARKADRGALASTKGAAATITLAPQAKALLAELKLAAGPVLPTAPVFRNTYGGHRQPRDVQRAFTQARDRAGLDGFRFHDLRHAHASELARAGVPVAMIQTQMRHAQLSMTLRYVHDVTSTEQASEALGTALAALGA